MTWVWISSVQSRAQENPSRKAKNVTLFCLTQPPAKNTWSKVKVTLSDLQKPRMHFAVCLGQILFLPLRDLKHTTFSWTIKPNAFTFSILQTANTNWCTDLVDRHLPCIILFLLSFKQNIWNATLAPCVFGFLLAQPCKTPDCLELSVYFHSL